MEASDHIPRATCSVPTNWSTLGYWIQHYHLLETTLQMRHTYVQAAKSSCISRLRHSPILSHSPISSALARQKYRPHAAASLTSVPIRHQQTQAPTRPQPLQNLAFWKCRHTWKRAMVNTTRCLIGCSLGDLSTMCYLMTYHPAMSATTSMSLSSKP